MNLETSKNLGGIGALLIFLGVFAAPIPIFGTMEVVDLIGIILLLIGMKGLADYYQTRGIFSNALYAVVMAIVGGVGAVAAIVITAVAAFAELGIDVTNPNNWSTIPTELTNQLTSSQISTLLTLAGAVIAALLILFVFAVLAGFFYRRSLNILSSKTRVGLFGVAGLLILIGAVLAIIIIGVLLIWIGFLITAIAFFRIKTQPSQVSSPTTSPSPQ